MVVINEAYISQLMETAEVTEDKVLLKLVKRLQKAYRSDDSILGMVIWSDIEKHMGW